MKTTIQYIKLLSIAIATLLIANTVSANWNPRPSSPPNNNAEAPLNVSSSNQIKLGTITAPQLTGSSSLCIGADCRTAWPSGGGSTSTSVGITGTGLANNLAIWTSPTNLTYKSLGDLQNRVTGTCSGNSAITRVNSDGTVVCGTNGGTCIYNGVGYSTGAETCQGSSKRQCQSSGSWSNSLGACSLSSSSGSSSGGSGTVCYLNGQSFSNGYSSCSYQSGTQSTKATCNNGSWSYQTVQTSSC